MRSVELRHTARAAASSRSVRECMHAAAVCGLLVCIIHAGSCRLWATFTYWQCVISPSCLHAAPPPPQLTPCSTYNLVACLRMQVAAAKQSSVGFLLDTKGPEVRTAMLKDAKDIYLEAGRWHRQQGARGYFFRCWVD